MAKVKQSDIADKLGVSVATVSMALSGKGNLSDEIRDKILKTASLMGYQVRSRDRKSNLDSKCLAILTYLNTKWFYLGKFVTPIYAQIEAVCLENGYYPLIIPITDFTTAKDLRETILQSRAKGLLSVYYYNEKLFDQLSSLGLPLVVINNSSSLNSYHTVCVDDYQGAGDGTQYLIDKGHRNILYMDYWKPEQPASVMDRFIGFKKAMDENTIPFDDSKRFTFDIHEYTELRSSVKNALKLHPETTAIFTHDDRLAILVMNVLDEMGLSIPGDISIIAPGDTLDYNLPYIPPITTMRIDTNMLGSMAAQQILQIINTIPEDLLTLKVTQQLVERSSVRDLN